MAKSFKNPTNISTRKGLDVLITDENTPQQGRKKKYTTYNIQVREDFREKLLMLKIKRNKTLTEIFDEVFTDYFNKNV